MFVALLYLSVLGRASAIRVAFADALYSLPILRSLNSGGSSTTTTVNLLQFERVGGNVHRIGTKDMVVHSTPEPGSMFLGSFGHFDILWFRRHHA